MKYHPSQGFMGESGRFLVTLNDWQKEPGLIRPEAKKILQLLQI